MSTDSTKGPRQGHRRRWWRLIGVVLAGLLLLSPVVWGVVEGRLRASVKAKLEEYRVAGQPVHIGDLSPHLVAAEDNAAEALIEAAREINWEPREAHVATRPDPRWMQEQGELVGQVLRRNSEVIELVQQACFRSETDWGLDYSDQTALTNSILYVLDSTRPLCYLLATAGHWEAQTGEDSRSVDRIGDILRVSEVVDEIPSRLAHFNAITMSSLACFTIEGALPYWDLKDPAAHKAAQELLGRLLDEKHFVANGERAWWGERAGILDDFQEIVGGGDGGSWLALPYKPILQYDLLVTMDNVTQIAEASVQSNYPQALRMLPPSGTVGGLSAFFHPFSSAHHYSLTEIELGFHNIALRRLAATALAMRLFLADNDRSAVALSELVPRYLPSLPTDPFTGGSQPLRIAGAGPSRLYSIGVHGTDGSALDTGDHIWGDVAFYLDGGRQRKPLEPLPDDSSRFQGRLPKLSSSRPSGPGT